MSQVHLDKTYDPKAVEDRWCQVWIDRRYGHAPLDHPGTPYTIVIPPPNVTGSLHIGHALDYSIQDILIRWRRMQGRNTLWMPGMDHAGIATQNVVEKHLQAEGTSRAALGREAFVARVWEWKAQSGGIIIEQLKRLGASCDWDRLRFTLDEGLSRAVREVFVRLHEDGLMYRGERLINWCPRCLTALSDIEVEHEDHSGKLYHILYPVVGDDAAALTVATTRPETMLGDTAVAVHPDDPRYNHLIGKRVRLPLTSRELPIVGDAILVNREFGTGAVKITPAHDFNDFEAGERHGLSRISILDEHARLDPFALKFKAKVTDAIEQTLRRKTVTEARSLVVEELRHLGLLVKVEDHKMALGKCYRCQTVVEPFLSPQWFVKIAPLAEPAIRAVEDGRIRIVPEGWANNYLGWMREIKDWCVSRQIWWGHRIPAWYCRACHREDELTATVPDSQWRPPQNAKPIVSRTQPTACPDCKSTKLLQDPDVLDTWFSSALWPFSTLGWPDETPELRRFYPTSTLVTGLDILFFWVARMIMMGLRFTGDVPFRDVYIHALVRDAEGQKMSKSKGNVIDPLHVMHQYGTDALRFTLASMASPGRDIKLAEERIEGYRNFANKIWNAARFILMHLEGERESPPPAGRPFADRWILSRVNHAIRQVTTSLEQYRFDQAASQLYHFIWHEYCDWYLELIKPALQADAVEARTTRQTLVESFDAILRLLHPFMPYLTEEIWHKMPHQGDSIMLQPFPTSRSDWDAKDAETRFEVLSKFVSTARLGRALLNLPPGQRVTLYGTSTDAEELETLTRLRPSAELLSKAALHLQPLPDWPTERVLRLAEERLSVGLAVEGDLDLNKTVGRLAKQRQDVAKEQSRLEGKLANPSFTSKAPREVVAEHEERLRSLKHEAAILASSEEQLSRMGRS